MLYVVSIYISIYWWCALCIISKCVVSFNYLMIIFATFVVGRMIASA